MYRSYLARHFKKQLKPFVKKYPALASDIVSTLEHFDPRQHSALGEDTYKIRLRSTDLPKGKSKSFRLIILLLHREHLLVPIALFLKSERSTITKTEIRWHIERLREELESQ